MILLWGPRYDQPICAVRRALHRAKQPALFLDMGRFAEMQLSLSTDGTPSGRLQFAGVEYALQDVSAAYLRPHRARQPIGGQARLTAAERECAETGDELLLSFTEVTDALVVNRLSTMGSNSSKPAQLTQIRDAGFDTPATIVTTDPERAAAFWEEHGDAIFKSTSGIRSIVTRLDQHHRLRLHSLVHCPTQFQEYIDGVDVRVHVVDEQLFACEIESRATDYRYADAADFRIRPTVLPKVVADRCRLLAFNLNLAVAGIDLRRRKDGRWCCFEVNASPGFTAFEGSQADIADAIARLLCRASPIALRRTIAAH